jgi:hypothetical protein
MEVLRKQIEGNGVLMGTGVAWSSSRGMIDEGILMHRFGETSHGKANWSSYSHGS